MSTTLSQTLNVLYAQLQARTKPEEYLHHHWLFEDEATAVVDIL